MYPALVDQFFTNFFTKKISSLSFRWKTCNVCSTPAKWIEISLKCGLLSIHPLLLYRTFSRYLSLKSGESTLSSFYTSSKRLDYYILRGLMDVLHSMEVSNSTAKFPQSVQSAVLTESMPAFMKDQHSSSCTQGFNNIELLCIMLIFPTESTSSIQQQQMNLVCSMITKLPMYLVVNKYSNLLAISTCHTHWLHCSNKLLRIIININTLYTYPTNGISWQ